MILSAGLRFVAVSPQTTQQTPWRERCFIADECPPTRPHLCKAIRLLGGPCLHIIHAGNARHAAKNLSGCYSSLSAARACVPPPLPWWLRADLCGSLRFRLRPFRVGWNVWAKLVCVCVCVCVCQREEGGVCVCVERLLFRCHSHFHTRLLLPSLAQLTHCWAPGWLLITVQS